jgi:hypothetical protein
MGSWRKAVVALAVGAASVGVGVGDLGGGVVEAASKCGYTTSFYKYSTTLLFVTVDVFKHGNRTDACGAVGGNFSAVWAGYNNCEKYGWGVAYLTKPGYTFSPTGYTSISGTATCRVSIGGSIGGVGLTYSKQSNTKHRFYWSGTTMMVGKSHWTTTP